MKFNLYGEGSQDVVSSFKNIRLPVFLAYSDIRQRYRRSSLGPFWITVSMGVSIACIGIIFGNIFKAPAKEFLPFLSVGLILWGFISSVITEATTVFPSSEGIIRQLPTPLFTHVIRMVVRNVYIFAHNLVVLPLVFLCVQKSVNFSVLLVVPGLILVLINLTWMALILSILCARYRDLTQIVSSVLQIFFYITPIIWMPTLLPKRASVMLLEPNPFFHLIAIVREPLLGIPPSLSNWAYSVMMAILGSLIALVFFNVYRRRISYWL